MRQPTARRTMRTGQIVGLFRVAGRLSQNGHRRFSAGFQIAPSKPDTHAELFRSTSVTFTSGVRGRTGDLGIMKPTL